MLIILHSCDQQLKELFKRGNCLFWCTVSEAHPILVWSHELWQIIMTVGTHGKEGSYLMENGEQEVEKGEEEIRTRYSQGSPPHVNFFQLSPSVNVSKAFSASVTSWR